MGKAQKNIATTIDCMKCAAACCKYVALEIDTPDCKRDYDNIRWYLMHKDVFVFIDNEDIWYLEFETSCDNLGEGNLCQRYEERPVICKDHGKDDEVCVFPDQYGDPHTHRFGTAEEFEAYLDERGTKWRRKTKTEKNSGKKKKKARNNT